MPGAGIVLMVNPNIKIPGSQTQEVADGADRVRKDVLIMRFEFGVTISMWFCYNLDVV
jgi:hypothetical protein